MTNALSSEDFPVETVEVDGCRLRYRAGGEGPTLVHVHGNAGPMVSAAYPLLARQFRLIALEMPGYGSEPADPTLTDTALMARRLNAALDAIGIETAALWGTSIGAKVALWMALLAPERATSLVLEAPAAIRPDGHSLLDIPPAELPPRIFAHPEEMTGPPPDPEEARRRLELTLQLQGPNRDEPFEERLAEIRVPTLVVFGTRDGMVPPEMGRHYPRLIPGARLVFMHDTAHAVQRERPQAFAELITDFLIRHDLFVINREHHELVP